MQRTAQLLKAGGLSACFALLSTLLFTTNASAGGTSRLDIQLPHDSTCLIRLSSGPLMRVPQQIVNARTCADPRMDTEVEEFPLTIQFPEMTMGSWTSAMSRIFAQEGGTDVLQVDEFPVRILYVFYPEQIKDQTLDQWSGPNPQVWQMKARRRLDSKMDDKDFEPRLVESKVKGLRKLAYAPQSYVEPPGPGGRYDQARGGVLIEPADADYDLLMSCDATIECRAFVQLNASRVQYRFLMPTEAVNHASEAIAAINRMIELWISQAKLRGMAH